MKEHKTTTRAEQMEDAFGALATCSCGWEDFWRIQDGSAEMAAYEHEKKAEES